MPVYSKRHWSTFSTEGGRRPKRTRALRKTQRGRVNALVRVPRNKLAFPQRMQTQLRYVDRQEFNLSGGAAVAPVYWKANGLFDPYYASGGHQPRGFDQFMEQYQMFTCTGAKIAVNWVYLGYDGPATTGPTVGALVKTTGTTTDENEMMAQTGVVVGVHKGTEFLTAGQAEEQMEKDKTSWKVMTPQSGSVTTGTALKVREWYGDFSIGAADYSGSDSADPRNELYFAVWAGKTSDNNVSTVTKVIAYVTITYDVTFTEPKALVAS